MEEPGQTRENAPDQAFALRASHARLEELVGELLRANQELRFRLAALEEDSAKLERGLAQSSTAALWP